MMEMIIIIIIRRMIMIMDNDYVQGDNEGDVCS